MKRAALALALAALAALAGCASRTGAAAAHVSHGAASPARTRSGAVLAFGTPARVDGANGAAVLLTPVSAWWLISGGNQVGETQPVLGHFLIIEMKLRPETEPTTFPLPLTGDGPSVISGGQVIPDTGDTASDDVVWSTCLPAVDSDLTLTPGETVVDSQTYDVPAASGLLRWRNAGGTTVTWRLPGRDTGPLPAPVRTAISTGNGC
ncbi:MAG TPA: hypothetical protein VMI33_25390 [Streptosporangiaceae bacterium]|nr:hypothetical protein [Streptosporangiaceae bacterium]